MPEEKLYIGSKLIVAYPLDRHSFYQNVKKQPYASDEENMHGYVVKYPDGYVSWSPKAVFEEAYREVSASEKELF